MKLIKVTLLALIIIGIGLLCTQKFWVQKLTDSILSHEKLVETIPPPQILYNGKVDCTGLCIPFDDNKYYGIGEDSVNRKTYSDAITNTTVKFQLLTGPEYRAQNPSFDVYVNGKLAGMTGGLSISETSFSPDHKYFAFITRFISGPGHEENELFVINLKTPIVMQLVVHPVVDKSITQILENDDSFIEGYTWGTDSISAIAFPVGEGEGSLYRIGIKTLWTFDLTDPQSVMRNGVVMRAANQD